jgi:hypothetical protein
MAGCDSILLAVRQPSPERAASSMSDVGKLRSLPQCPGRDTSSSNKINAQHTGEFELKVANNMLKSHGFNFTNFEPVDHGARCCEAKPGADWRKTVWP